MLTILIIHQAEKNIHASLSKTLTLEVETLIKMLDRESKLKQENIKNNIKVANHLFNEEPFRISKKQEKILVKNQLSSNTHYTSISEWYLGNKKINGNYDLVDKVQELVGATSTIFQKTDSGYVRISTNVKDENGLRAINTFIPNQSVVVTEVEKGKTYFGRALVVFEWYITAYEPIIYNDSIVGMLYVGVPEKDLGELRKIISELTVGKNGFPFVFDVDGNMIIHRTGAGENWNHKAFIKQIMNAKKGLINFRDSLEKNHTIAFDYHPTFGLYVAAILDLDDETSPLIRSIIIFSILTALVFIILLSIFVYRLTSRRFHNFLLRLESSNKLLSSTKKALEMSENQFRTLFNNTSDDIFVLDFDGKIIEVNDKVCESLGFSREELVRKRFNDIKTPKYVNTVRTNLDLIKKFGQYQYESEHVAKDGHIIPVEMKSRFFNFNGQDLILTIARDMTERKKVEQKIITTIIETEEIERKRFAADLHDGLAPILSAIKLYTDLLVKGNMKKLTIEEAVKNIDELTDQAMISTKEISNNIMPNVLQDFGLAIAISDFCTYINKTQSINIKLITKNYTETKRGIEETILYQTVKELINNTLKHSGARNIIIDLKSYQNQIQLYYRDDGKGFEMENVLGKSKGLGLNNIFNKIKTIKGTIDLNTSIGIGMFILITVSVNKEDQQTQ